MIDATCFSLRSMHEKLRDSVVSRQLGYFYIPIGKAANTEIKRKLWQIEHNSGYQDPPPPNYFGVHSYGWHKNQISKRPWEIYSPDDYSIILKDLKTLNVFSVVRNPYSRLLSGYLDKMSVGKELTHLQKIEKAKEFNLLEYPDSFASFVQQICHQSDYEADLHWQSQSYILCFDFIKYDAIGHLEHLEKFYDFLDSKFLVNVANENVTTTQNTIVHKTSASSKLVDFYTPKLMEDVYQRYEQDFINFGYDKSIDSLNSVNVEKSESNGKYGFLLDLIGGLVYEAKHNKRRKVSCKKIEDWSRENAEIVMIDSKVMHRTEYLPLENLPNNKPKDTLVSDMHIKNTNHEQFLSIETIQGALVTPLVTLKRNDLRYAKTVRLLGGIYNSKGEPHEKSLLTRANNRFQDFDTDYKPQINHKITRIKKGVYGGIIFINHYGHFLLETLSRAWALKQYPEEDVYFHLAGTKLKSFGDLGTWQKELFEAALINIKRLHVITETTYFDELIVPEAGYVLQNYCHKKQAQALTKIGQRIKIKAEIKPIKEKIWLSRSLLKKGAIAGEKEYEQALEKEGFSIIHPELISIKDQITLFENADTIAGFTGSAFHTLLFTQNHKAKVIHFTRGKAPHNDYRICAEVKAYQAEYYNFFIKNGVLEGVPANVIQDLGKIWQILYEQRLVKTKTYHDPDLELKLHKLDEETQKLNPHLFNEKISMNGKTNIDTKNSPLVLPKAITHSARRINKLAKEIDPHNYLEIGVNKGHTFFKVSIPQRTAVDPKFIFDVTTITDKNVTLNQATSDEFFSKLPMRFKYDVIFIDGLHTFEQTYRDLCNSLLHSHEQTVFLIDDTKPNDAYSAIPHQDKALRYRKEAGGLGGAWHGDVYKVVFALHDFHPGLNYRTIIGSGNPQTLVWRSNSGWREPLFNSLEQISRLSYFDLLDHIHILRNCSEEEAIGLCLNELASQ